MDTINFKNFPLCPIDCDGRCPRCLLMDPFMSNNVDAIKLLSEYSSELDKSKQDAREFYSNALELNYSRLKETEDPADTLTTEFKQQLHEMTQKDVYEFFRLSVKHCNEKFKVNINKIFENEQSIDFLDPIPEDEEYSEETIKELFD